MTREQKIALILGFALVLVVGVLVSDHLSGAREAQLVDIDMPEDVDRPILRTRGSDEQLALDDIPPSEPAQRLAHIDDRSDPVDEPPLSDTGSPPTLAQGDGSRDDPSAMDRMRDRVADAMNQLTNGKGPRPAVQTETITMGEPIGGREREEDVRTHIVRKGETLWKIAEKYYGTGFVHEDLLRYNRSRIRSTREINPGLTLLIPPRHKLDDPPVSLSSVQESNQRQKTTNATAPKTRTYTVRMGDTLSEISQSQLGTSKRWEEILELNERLDEPTDIYVGMKLTLPAR